MRVTATMTSFQRGQAVRLSESLHTIRAEHSKPSSLYGVWCFLGQFGVRMPMTLGLSMAQELNMAIDAVDRVLQAGDA